MNKVQAEKLAAIVRTEGDTAKLTTGMVTVCTVKRGVYVVRVPRVAFSLEQYEFASYEDFIGTEYHDIARPEREDREREEYQLWRELSRTEARLHGYLLAAASHLRRVAEDAESTAKQLGELTDRALDSQSVEGVAGEFLYRVGDAMRRIQNVPGNAVVPEAWGEKVGDIRMICATIARLQGGTKV